MYAFPARVKATSPELTMSRLFPLLMLLSLVAGSACSSLVVTDPTSPYYMPPVGSRVVVKQRLTVPPGMTRVFLQYGKVIPKHARNDYAVNCNFEINTLSDSPRYIEVGTYTVSRSQRRTDNIVRLEPIRLAALDRLAGLMTRRDDGAPLMFEEVRLSLTSTPPSDVRELACRGVMADPSEIMLPTLAEMRQALGAYATIEVPGEGGR
jgi:hypothetical protein